MASNLKYPLPANAALPLMGVCPVAWVKVKETGALVQVNKHEVDTDLHDEVDVEEVDGKVAEKKKGRAALPDDPK